MKLNKHLIYSTAIALMFSIGCAHQAPKPKPVPIPAPEYIPPAPDGVTDASIEHPSVIAAAKFAVNAIKNQLQSKSETQSTTLSLVKLLKATSQVVEGFSYKVTMILNNHQLTLAFIVIFYQYSRSKPFR